MRFLTLLKTLIWALTIIITIYFTSCKTSKDVVNFNDVKQGYFLDKAQEIQIDTFLTFWIENNIQFKFDYNLNELYKDSAYTYFGKQNFYNQNFYKVRNVILNKVDYHSIVGDSVRYKFYYEVIPLIDRNKQNNCSSAKINFDYTYRYIETENSIEVKCRYKVLCEFLFNIINKDYVAKYYIGTKTIEKTEIEDKKEDKN